MIERFDKPGLEFLSNFHPVKITVGSLTFPSVEHAFQAGKTQDMNEKLIFTDINLSPGKAKRLGKKVKLVPNWESVKLLDMRALVTQKFSQEPLKSMLIATGDEEIQEGNNWGDTFWGIDLKTGAGENHLGIIIMQCRKHLKGE